MTRAHGARPSRRGGRPGWRRKFRFLFALPVLLALGCAAPRRLSESKATAEVFVDRPDGLVRRVTYLDSESGGGVFLFTDPAVASLSAVHSNQAALGGGSSFLAGPMNLILDTNTAAVIGAGGTALGNVIGAAAKAAVK